MSDSNTNNDPNSGDYNEMAMQTVLLLVVVLGTIVLLACASVIIKDTYYSLCGTDTNNTKANNKAGQKTEPYTALNDADPNEEENAKPRMTGDQLLSVSIKSKQGDLIDVRVKKDEIPIDYWIFEQMGKDDLSITDGLTVYMTDLQDSTFSNQNLRHLFNEVLRRGECGWCDTPASTRNQKRVLINWIFNHSRFTSAQTKRYRMYNLYKKYFPLPLEADDYETPLLDSASKFSTRNPTDVTKNDIVAENHLDVPETTKVMCSDQLFVEQDRDFSLYCNGDYLKWVGERSDSYQPVIARYYLVVVADPNPVFSYTADGLVMITDNSLPSNNNQNRFKYESNTDIPITKNDKEKTTRIELLSDLIKEDPLISWRRVRTRVDQKLAKLGELMILEHRQESTVDGIQELMDRTNINLYQTFAVDIVVRSGEPYILKITASPSFREYGSKVAEDLLQSIVERIKLMLRL